MVLANANKSAVPRIHGWPDERLFLALSGLPRTHTPRPNRLRLLIANIALGSITPKLAYIVVAQGMKPKAGNQTRDCTFISILQYH